MDIAILDEIIGPNVIGIGRCKRRWSLSTCAPPRRTFDLEARVLPQTMDTLAIDYSLAPQQRPNVSVAVARILLGQDCNLCKQSLHI